MQMRLIMIDCKTIWK